MNPFEFVLAIIVIATIGKVMQARYGYRRGSSELDEDSERGSRRSRRGRSLMNDPADGAETARLKDEVRALKDRLQVLERITVEKESSLNREIDNLRDR
jgi:hypothetical protein